MPILSKPATAAYLALIYITVGALILVWTGTWYYMKPPETVVQRFLLTGFALTGLTLFIIGLAVGRIGRAARHAELPPPEVTAASARAEQDAAQRAPMIAAVNPGMPVNPAMPAPVTGPVPANTARR